MGLLLPGAPTTLSIRHLRVTRSTTSSEPYRWRQMGSLFPPRRGLNFRIRYLPQLTDCTGPGIMASLRVRMVERSGTCFMLIVRLMGAVMVGGRHLCSRLHGMRTILLALGSPSRRAPRYRHLLGRCWCKPRYSLCCYLWDHEAISTIHAMGEAADSTYK